MPLHKMNQRRIRKVTHVRVDWNDVSEGSGTMFHLEPYEASHHSGTRKQGCRPKGEKLNSHIFYFVFLVAFERE